MHLPVWREGVHRQGRWFAVGLLLQALLPLQVQGRTMPATSLRKYIDRHGGMRLSLHPGARDRLIAWAIEEFPVDAPRDRVAEVLSARLRRRVRSEHGSIVATILIGVLVNLIVRLIVEWWMSRSSHRVLMEGWHKNALAAANISDTPPAA